MPIYSLRDKKSKLAIFLWVINFSCRNIFFLSKIIFAKQDFSCGAGLPELDKRNNRNHNQRKIFEPFRYSPSPSRKLPPGTNWGVVIPTEFENENLENVTALFFSKPNPQPEYWREQPDRTGIHSRRTEKSSMTSIIPRVPRRKFPGRIPRTDLCL